MFTCVGRRTISGVDCCGVEHESRDAAQKCLVSHQAEMRKRNKVSDRSIVEVESLEEVYDD